MANRPESLLGEKCFRAQARDKHDACSSLSISGNDGARALETGAKATRNELMDNFLGPIDTSFVAILQGSGVIGSNS